MNKKIILLFLVSIFFVLACSTRSPEGSSEWKGTIEYLDGIRVVKNPEEPLYGHLQFDLEKDLTLGSDKDEVYMFYRVEGLGVDSEGNIYVLDSGNYRIQKYDSEGNHLQTIGRKGQGPGELDTPYGMFLSFENIIYVHDGMKIKAFKTNGSFIQEITLDSFTHDISVDLNRDIWGIGRLPSEEGRTRSIIKLNKKGKLEKIIDDFPPPKVAVRSEGGRGVTFFIGHEYVPQLSFIAIDEKTLLYAHSSNYRLHLIDENGYPEMIIMTDVLRSSISQREKDEIYKKNSDFEKKWPKDVVKDAIQFPPHRPFFNKILADNKGRIYVERVKSVLEKSGMVEIDIFSRDGYYLYSTNAPVSPELIRNGFLYHLHSEEITGGIVIERFKINNWSAMRQSLQH
jgi:hypothetical protein